MALNEEAGKWPEDFFKTKLNERDLKILRDGVSEMEKTIISTRRNRRDVHL